MTEDNSTDYVVPVVSEELHADAVPVQTGSVRVVKRVEGHEEILEQELRKQRAEVKRVKTNRLVEGPQQPYREGNTLIIPVVSEVLRVEKQWVLTEEIHVIQIDERETVEQRVEVKQEVADVERLDEAGAVVSSTPGPTRDNARPLQRAAAATRTSETGIVSGRQRPPGQKKVLSKDESIIKGK